MTISTELILIATIRGPLGSSSLGGCPASCPDTYRLTHDHRHVRNWAEAEISVLNFVRKEFFSVGIDFPNVCLRDMDAGPIAERALSELKLS